MADRCRRAPDPSGQGCPGKKAWPELVGKKANDAVRTIEDENRYIDNIIVVHQKPPAGVGFAGVGLAQEVECCNRVFIIVDAQNIVVDIPYMS